MPPHLSKLHLLAEEHVVDVLTISSLSPYLDSGIFVLGRSRIMMQPSDITRTLFISVKRVSGSAFCPTPKGCISICLCFYLGMLKLMLIPALVRKDIVFILVLNEKGLYGK